MHCFQQTLFLPFRSDRGRGCVDMVVIPWGVRREKKCEERAGGLAGEKQVCDCASEKSCSAGDKAGDTAER